MAERRPHVDPAAFVRDGGTLYSLSKVAGAPPSRLVTTLTVAVVEAAEKRAATSPRGRLRTPLLAVLNEAANVRRWRELPNLYSHYGSRSAMVDHSSAPAVVASTAVSSVSASRMVRSACGS